MRLIAFMVAAEISLCAQQVPDAAGLLHRRAQALEKYHSYEYTEVTSETTVARVPTTTTLVQGVNPGKRRMESKIGTMATLTVVSNGADTWMYSPMMHRYTKTLGDLEGSKDATGGMGAASSFDEAALVANAKVSGSEVLEVGGEPHDCWVIEGRVPNAGGKPGSGFQDAAYAIWIDKTLGIELMSTVSGKVSVPGQPEVTLRMKTVKQSLKLNLDLADSLFVFTPPDGATETAELFPGMGGGPSKSAAGSPKATSTARPQAFVPGLNPTDRIESVYPEDARGKGLQGVVQVLLTIDSQGRVVSAEALSGSEVFRPAAIDAVKQWKFSPVLRNGKPVDAYTDATLMFIAHGELAKGDNFRDNMADTLAAAQRTMALQAEFPRSPGQVLADTEQNISGASAQERLAALPQLAKAAIDAGALDKARAYAAEILQAATDSHDWNYGNAIHDGNMVLGLVALAGR